jgi:hypothetical protein
MGRAAYVHAKSPKHYLDQRLDKSGDCWLWTIGTDKDGYGQCHDTKYGKLLKCSRAHQLSYLAYNGEYDRSLFICHTCHNPSCCNPDHLYAGTALENNQDMVSAGRDVRLSKEDSPRAKLTQKQVDEIMSLKGIKTCVELCEIYGVSFGHICRIWRNERWVKPSTTKA